MIYDDLLNRPSVHFQHEYQAKRKTGVPQKVAKLGFGKWDLYGFMNISGKYWLVKYYSIWPDPMTDNPWINDGNSHPT